MTDKQQPPERIFADMDTGDWFPKPCGEHPELLVEYSLLQRVPDDKRLAEIRERHGKRRCLDFGQLYSDVGYLLSLLQPPPAASERCGECERLRQRVLELETEIDTKAGYL